MGWQDQTSIYEWMLTSTTLLLGHTAQVKKMLQVLVTFAMATEFPITDTWATQLQLCTLPTRGFQAN